MSFGRSVRVFFDRGSVITPERGDMLVERKEEGSCDLFFWNGDHFVPGRRCFNYFEVPEEFDPFTPTFDLNIWQKDQSWWQACPISEKKNLLVWQGLRCDLRSFASDLIKNEVLDSDGYFARSSFLHPIFGVVSTLHRPGDLNYLEANDWQCHVFPDGINNRKKEKRIQWRLVQDFDYKNDK